MSDSSSNQPSSGAPLERAAELIETATQARLRAQAQFSQFKVGAALLSSQGQVFSGCNVENASYGLTMCAERVAIFKAISEGVTEFEAICVVADTQTLTPPCGSCRQLIWEKCGDIPVLLANLRGDSRQFTSGQLLPFPFDRSSLTS
ncbi:MAG TPA: cytidine deaminase [Acidobacteriota bacterium]|nr:cytidine deaminase [Acidobacteriota bacterium]